MKARALVLPSPGHLLAHAGDKFGVRTRPAPIECGLGTVGVIKRQYGRLGEGIGSPKTGRVLRVAFDLGRPAFIAFDKEADSPAGEGHCGCKEERLAENHAFRLTDVGEDLVLRRMAGAPGDSRESEGRPEKGKEAAARDRV